MLEQLDTIDWANLKHAYGSAADVPDSLRDLASPKAETREQGLYHLYGNIFHQGSRYQATPYAIPFLYELIETDAVEDKYSLIALLVNLVLGYEEEYLPQGIDPEAFRKELQENEAELTDEERANSEKYGHDYLAIINCYDFVKEGLPILRNCLKSEEATTRIAALHACAWFPEEAQQSIAAIRAAWSHFKEEQEIANAILAISLLSRRSKESVAVSPIHAYLIAESTLLRICAAIALAKSPMDKVIMDILIEGILEGEAFHNVEGLLFNEGRLTGYASATLSTYGMQDKEKIVPALCQVLATVNPYQALDITYALISIIRQNQHFLFVERKVDELTSLEVMALTAIYEHGGWTIGKSEFANYVELLQSSGIPPTKEDLGKYLNGE